MTLDELIVVLGYKIEGEAELKRFQAGLEQTEQKAETFVGKIGRFGAAAGGALAVAGGVAFKEFAGVERTLTRIGVSADASREKMVEVRGQLQGMADDFAYPSLDAPVQALDAFVASGRSIDEAIALLPSTLATAQASGSAPIDIALSADAIARSFGLAADEMQSAFDILSAGGKAGMFELKDMSSELPSLSSAFAALGYDGLDGLRELVALLQTIRLETGSSAEAATNAANVFQKIGADQTKRSFESFGVDLGAAMAAGAEQGLTPIQSFMQATEQALQGDLGRIPQLFTDMQVAQGMRALMGNRDDLSGFQAAVSPEQAEGSVQVDLVKILGDSAAEIDRTMSAWERFKTEAGAAIAPVVGGVAGSLADDLTAERLIAEGLRKRGVDGAFNQWRAQQSLTSDIQGADPSLYRMQAFDMAMKRLAAEGRGTIASSAPLLNSEGNLVLQEADLRLANAANDVASALEGASSRLEAVGAGISTSSASTSPQASTVPILHAPAQSSDMNAAATNAALDNLAGNIEAMGAKEVNQNIQTTIAPNDNRQFPVSVSAPVTVTVQQASQAPAAIGNAISGAINAAANVPARMETGPAQP